VKVKQSKGGLRGRLRPDWPEIIRICRNDPIALPRIDDSPTVLSRMINSPGPQNAVFDPGFNLLRNLHVLGKPDAWHDQAPRNGW
jgi:hypothetical protein